MSDMWPSIHCSRGENKAESELQSKAKDNSATSNLTYHRTLSYLLAIKLLLPIVGHNPLYPACNPPPRQEPIPSP